MANEWQPRYPSGSWIRQIACKALRQIPGLPHFWCYAANGYKTVPRLELIPNLILLLDHQVLRWPGKLPLRLVLEQELLNQSAGTRHPESSEDHDDLVMAIAIAVWHAKCVSPEIMPKPKDDGTRRWNPQGPLFCLSVFIRS